VKGIALNGCFSIDSINIEKEDYPSIPTISIVDSFLISSKSGNYQWYFNDELLEGDTLEKLKILTNGKYFVSTSTGRCVVSSAYYFSNLGVSELNIDKYRIYPNPIQSNYLNIDGIKGNEEIKIYSISGESVLFTIKSNNSILIENIENGMYILELTSPHTKFQLKFVKNE
jgi:hypothetical protein